MFLAHKLWEVGVETFDDALPKSNISIAFSLYGWSRRGEFACPCMRHRRFRSDAHSFDGTQEYRSAPSPPSASVILRQLEASNGTENWPWKNKKKKKYFIFFTLLGEPTIASQS